MQVRCEANIGSALKPEYLSLGYTVESRFDLSVGNAYLILAMMLWNSQLMILLKDDSGQPNWHPLELFSVIDHHLSDEWFFSTQVGVDHGVQALWGYECLVKDKEHYERVLEREPSALDKFHREYHRLSSQSPT
jgi:hypothetical protein